MNRNPRNLREVQWNEPLDLAGVRAHMKEMHPGEKIPRATADVSRRHLSIHHRYATSHLHCDSELVLIVGSTRLTQERWLGWYTGQGAVLRTEVNRRSRERLGQPDPLETIDWPARIDESIRLIGERDRLLSMLGGKIDVVMIGGISGPVHLRGASMFVYRDTNDQEYEVIIRDRPQ